ncbi:hypothetical protein FRACA_1920003 [Frankia canadensis]|uniref:Uncharacterized protein n=1 Tax=Frankia canadensis TaxID=1836972 RepID=A0A2I2KPA8_9ACTN|nr:hypothetical protein FRACA_1920003 [Frankia canadensis]SOU54797.1 hypothetical protein FRACA_1920003 [Frankia canadensis]
MLPIRMGPLRGSIPHVLDGRHRPGIVSGPRLAHQITRGLYRIAPARLRIIPTHDREDIVTKTLLRNHFMVPPVSHSGENASLLITTRSHDCRQIHKIVDEIIRQRRFWSEYIAFSNPGLYLSRGDRHLVGGTRGNSVSDDLRGCLVSHTRVYH